MSNRIQFTVGQGLGRPLVGEDHISGALFYTTTLPTGFTNSARNAEIFSVSEAEALGIASTGNTAIMHYHISEYFRTQPRGDLFVGIYSSDTTFDEVTQLQNYADGKINVMGIYTQSAFATSQLNTLQGQYATCDSNYKPLQIFLQANFSGTTLASLGDMTQQTSKNVSVLIGQDGGNTGAALYTASAKTVGTMGAFLGTVSRSKVSENIAWVGKYQIAGDGELETLAFANGALYSAQADSLIDALDAKGYIFLRKHVGIAGSYWNNPYTCIASTNDFCRINANRVMDKAKRSIRTTMLPALGSPVRANADGTLSENDIAYFQSLAEQGLDGMLRAAEISDYRVTINPAQDTLSTGVIQVSCQIIPIGSTDVIDVLLRYAVSLA